MAKPQTSMPQPLGLVIDRKRNRTILLVEPSTLVMPVVEERRPPTAFDRTKAQESAPLSAAIATFFLCFTLLAVLAFCVTEALTALLELL
jgi:hypothetical protein